MYCFNCMKEAESRAICPYCHKQNVPDRIPHHLAPGTVLNGQYIVGNSLGEGGFGITYVGRDTKLQMRVAIKEYYPLGKVSRDNSRDNNVYTATPEQTEALESGKESFLREARSIARFSGEKGVVNIKNYFEEHNTAYIIMDYLEGDNLLQYIDRHGNFDARTLFKLMLPIMRSLQKIHEENVIHRDISPDNIIISPDNSLTLTDFGSARYFSNQNAEMSIMLKQGYAPEEQYRSTGNQGPWTDVYGLCATIYKCITGVTPQSGLDRAHSDMLKKPSQLGAVVSPALETVLMYGLAVYQNERCRDMKELIELTENALRGKAANIPAPLFDDERTVGAESGGFVKAPVRPEAYSDGFRQRPIPTPTPERRPDPNYAAAPPKQQSKGPLIAAVIIAAVAVILAAVVLVMVLGKNDGDDKNEAQTTAAATTAETYAQETVRMVAVPDVSGKTRKEAASLIGGAGLDYAMESRTTSELSEDNKVLEQSPKGGENVSEGSKVTLYIGQYEAPQTEPITEAPTESAKKIMYCRASHHANIRVSPSSKSTSIGQVPSRAAVEVLDTSGDFYRIKYNGVTGYVWSEAFSEDINAPLYTEEEETTYAVISSSNTDMYCRASDEASFRSRPTSLNGDFIITKIPSGAKVRYISSTQGELITYNGKTFYEEYESDKNREFYKVEYNGQTGYVIAKFFSSDPNAPIVTDSW